MPDYDFYRGLYSGQQVDSAVARALSGGQLDQDIAAIRAAVGSPLVANTAAEMTNVNKVYVYTGSEAGYSTGHWYYYEGGEWNDGGLYNSAAADDEMSDSSTNAVQNKIIKAYVDTAISEEQTRAEGVEALKAPLASPALTGTPIAPTAPAGTSSTQIATTAYADNAVSVEKARAEAVEATKADKSYADYILLREEEDRQILFGSIVQAAEDTYAELRAAPIHNAITIGGSVYPRMDRTRMAIDAIKGRTVAFNQLVTNGDFSNGTDGWQKNSTASIAASDNVLTLTTGASTSNRIYHAAAGVVGHKHLITATINPSRQVEMHIGFSESESAPTAVVVKNCNANTWTVVSGIINPTDVGYVSARCRSSVEAGDVIKFQNVMLIDLTAMYGTTIADYLYGLETATAGAGVSYVRQRLPLDYYASDSGELKAPVVSGVTVTGFNAWDEVWESGTIDATTGANNASSSFRRSKNYTPVLPDTDYYFKGREAASTDYRIFSYDADKNYIGAGDYTAFNKIIHIGANTHFIRFIGVAGNSAWRNICINLSNPSRNGEYEPYQHTSLSIPSTRLDGVGTAQDYIEVVEDGENDYSLHLHKVMGEVDLGDLTWTYTTDQYGSYFRTAVPSRKAGSPALICPKYVTGTETGVANITDKMITSGSANTNLYVRDSSYTDAATFKTAMSGVPLLYELATPVETVIAEHLTLAEVSAIAENGGIISIVNSNGHIVQPDFVADVVISRSAS